MTEQQFIELCRENRDLRFELTADKELVIMAPTGSETGLRQNSEICLHADGLGQERGNRTIV